MRVSASYASDSEVKKIRKDEVDKAKYIILQHQTKSIPSVSVPGLGVAVDHCIVFVRGDALSREASQDTFNGVNILFMTGRPK